MDSDSSKFDLEREGLASQDQETEDKQTLAAIDEGLKDADGGRVVSAEDVRKRLSKWITGSSTRKGR